MTHKGSCHCGQVTFEVEGTFDTAMECNCSHCSRKGYLLWFVPRTQLTVPSPEANARDLHLQQARHQASFLSQCEARPSGWGASRGTEMAAINVRCLEDVELGSIKHQFVDGRSFYD